MSVLLILNLLARRTSLRMRKVQSLGPTPNQPHRSMHMHCSPSCIVPQNLVMMLCVTYIDAMIRVSHCQTTLIERY